MDDTNDVMDNNDNDKSVSNMCNQLRWEHNIMECSIKAVGSNDVTTTHKYISVHPLYPSLCWAAHLYLIYSIAQNDP